MRVLVLEDDKHSYEGVWVVLYSRGITDITWESTIEGALERVSMDRDYDMIIADYHLGNLNAKRFLEELGENHPMVIVATNARKKKMQNELIALGCAAVLDKHYLGRNFDEFLASQVS